LGFGRTDPPLDVERDKSGGGDGWVTLARAANDIEAHLLIGRLGSAGVETNSVKDRTAPGSWIYSGSNPWAPVTVLVKRLQLDDARLVLAELAFEGPDATKEALQPAGRWRGPLLWWTAAVGIGVLFTGLGLLQAANEMERCRSSASCRDASGANP
jgi:hypothetical protein